MWLFPQRFELVATASATNRISYFVCRISREKKQREKNVGLEAEVSATSGGRISLANGSEGGRPTSEQQEQESHFDTPPRVIAKRSNFVILNQVMLIGANVREAN